MSGESSPSSSYRRSILWFPQLAQPFLSLVYQSVCRCTHQGLSPTYKTQDECYWLVAQGWNGESERGERERHNNRLSPSLSLSTHPLLVTAARIPNSLNDGARNGSVQYYITPKPKQCQMIRLGVLPSFQTGNASSLVLCVL